MRSRVASNRVGLLPKVQDPAIICVSLVSSVRILNNAYMRQQRTEVRQARAGAFSIRMPGRAASEKNRLSSSDIEPDSPSSGNICNSQLDKADAAYGKEVEKAINEQNPLQGSSSR